ncbi:MAG: MFS transporter, partial [Roseibium sp.]
LVADHSPPDQAGSLMTFQTALGFALTFATVQLTPALALAIGWPAVFIIMALGPAFGIAAMLRLKQLTR